MGSPPRLRPGTSPQTFRIPPRGGHPVLRLSSRQTTNLGTSPWLYPSFPTSCPFRVLLIHAPRPTRRYPRLWIWRPSSERQRDFNPPDLGAAQHTLRASPPPTRPGLTLAGCPLRLPPLSPSVSRASCAFLRCMPSSLPRRICKVHLSLTSFATLAFPECPAGRLPHQSFRGLIERSLALRPASSRDHQVTLSIEGSDEFVASSAASIATGQATLPRRDFHPLEYTRIHGAPISPIIWPNDAGPTLAAPALPRRQAGNLSTRR